MKAVVDFHGHLYPSYDLNLLFESLIRNSRKRYPETTGIHVMFLAEREGQDWFEKTQKQGEHVLACGWNCKPLSDGITLELEKNGSGVFLVSGRQIISKERLEVLSLGYDCRIVDGVPIDDIIDQILQGGGIPVLPWAPGKWLFERGDIVQRVLDERGKSIIYVGDTCMRPSLYSGGKVFAKSREDGFTHLPGSDPLISSGEEVLAGKYSTCIEIEGVVPGEEIKAYLNNGKSFQYQPSGSSFYSAILRTIRLKIKKF